MRELLTKGNGPLEETLERAERAIQLEDEINNPLNTEDFDFESAVEEVHRLDHEHPLMGNNVTITGEIILSSPDIAEGFNHAMVKTNGSSNYPPYEEEVVSGTFMGFQALAVFNSFNGRKVCRVAYDLRTGEEVSRDKFGNCYKYSAAKYIAVEKAIIEPTYPVNMHSYKMLANDPVIEMFHDVLVETTDREKAIRRLGVVAAREFNNGPLDVGDILNRQRVSYLNTFGLLDDVKLQTNDLVWPNPENGSLFDGVFSDTDNTEVMIPKIFDIDYAYLRVGDTARSLSEVELYVRGASALDNFSAVLAPARNVRVKRPRWV